MKKAKQLIVAIVASGTAGLMGCSQPKANSGFVTDASVMKASPGDTATGSLSQPGSTSPDGAQGSISQPGSSGNGQGSIGQPGSSGNGQGSIGQPGSSGNGQGSIGQPGSSGNGQGSLGQPGSSGNSPGTMCQPGADSSVGSLGQPGAGSSLGSLGQPSSTSACTSASTADINAFSAALQSANSPSSDILLNGCSVSLGGFVATPYTASGSAQSLKQVQSIASPGIGAGCGLANVEFAEFADYGYVQSGTVKTDICKPGSASPCSPSSNGYLFEIQWSSGSGNSVQQIVLANGTTVTKTDMTCSSDPMGAELISPLVIEDQPGVGIVTLNPLSTNTYFDLTGTGVLDRISCVQNGSFLALPNSNGKIINIDQLFGNNTVINGEKSANGFIALGKYDSNGDGVIDDQDPVFAQLRLWHDLNCDGIAQDDEIAPLASLNIKAIHYAQTEAMDRVDHWGNVTKQRANVDFASGEFSAIFDLWFLPAN